MVQFPAFAEDNFTQNQANNTSTVVNLMQVDGNHFSKYCRLLESNGYTQKQYRELGGNIYAAYQNKTGGIFLNYYHALKEINIAIEENCRYFDYIDTCGEAVVDPQITQLYMDDFGMSYAVRLSDGRFLVIDGGYNLQRDAQRLLQCLQEGTAYPTPVVAAWLFTHPHRDHYHCFNTFVELYGDKVKIEKVLYNFPEADDFAHYPELKNEDWRLEHSSDVYNIPLMKRNVEKLGISTYMVHTGQVYQIGDAVCEILSCMDDTIFRTRDVNASSVVVRMELGGQVILWAADAAFDLDRLPQRYGSYLKADIMQVPHHGFGCGDDGVMMQGYDYIAPKVCLMPVSDNDAFNAICTFRESTRYLMTRLDLDELIIGEPQRTITLPYTAPLWAKAALHNRYLAGLDNNGSTAWMFTGLNTSQKEDFEFCFMNTTAGKAEVTADIFFADGGKAIRFISITVPGETYRKICITDEKQVVMDKVFFNFDTIARKGIPENAPFAVRFISDRPIVVSHDRHTAAYHAPNR